MLAADEAQAPKAKRKDRDNIIVCRITEAVLDESASKVGVVLGVQSGNQREVIAMARGAAKLGRGYPGLAALLSDLLCFTTLSFIPSPVVSNTEAVRVLAHRG